jgi:hypothetical protein
LVHGIYRTGIPFDNVNSELVTQPFPWHPKGIGRFMLITRMKHRYLCRHGWQ